MTACRGEQRSPEISTPTPQEIYDSLLEAEFFDPPYLMPILEVLLPDYNVNTDDSKSFTAMEAAISALFIQLIIIEAEENKADSVYAAMKEHRQALLNDAFYPQGAQAAAASIVNKNGNLIWLICDERAEDINKKIEELIEAE